ncbi:MAG: ferredoxin--NADP reductase [Pikeienuella sp.]
MPDDQLQTSSNAVRVPDPLPNGVFAEEVLSVTHYTDRLFAFRTTRPESFRFRSGEFAMIGLEIGGKPLYRAYSIASPAWDEELEFFSIKVEDGPLTSVLQHVRPGDRILLRKKPTGTLVNDALLPGKRLYMLSTGTGVAPFVSLIRDPETYEKFESVILTHTTREVAELKYGFDIVAETKANELLAEMAAAGLVHAPATTRESFATMGRITKRIEDGSLFDALGVPAFDPATDRVMICGSMEMLRDCKALCEKAGMSEGANNKPGEFVVERAFVD